MFEGISTLILFIAEEYSLVGKCYDLFTHFPMAEPLGCFCFLAFVNKAAMSIVWHVYLVECALLLLGLFLGGAAASSLEGLC